MRTSSPVPDTAFSEPYDLPEPSVIQDADAKNENEFAALGLNSQKYPAVVAYIRERQEFYRKYMPDGASIIAVSSEDAGAWWKCAATIIAELDAFVNIVEVNADAVRESR